MSDQKEERMVAIMFADVSGSTRMYERYGDHVAREQISRCISLMIGVTERHMGRVVKTIGDEVMCVFSSPDLAAQAASAIQTSIQEGAWEVPMAVKIGFHYGPVIEEGGDVFGDAVNVAARLVSQSKPRMVITSGETVEALSADFQSQIRRFDRMAVKGREKPVELCELLWEEEDEADLTFMPGAMAGITGGTVAAPAQEEVQAQLTLRFQGREIEVKPGGFSIGRGDGNDLVVNEHMASRQHASIAYRRGKFVLADQSINGTYVLTASGDHLPLRREEWTLLGRGSFCLGKEVSEGDENRIEFDCRLGAPVPATTTPPAPMDLALDLADETLVPARLVLELAGSEFIVKEGDSLVLGRSTGSDVVVPEPMASRSHAKVRFAEGRFLLADQSSNGTFVEVGGQRTTLHNNEMALEGEGFISLGREMREGDPNRIRFRRSS